MPKGMVRMVAVAIARRPTRIQRRSLMTRPDPIVEEAPGGEVPRAAVRSSTSAQTNRDGLHLSATRSRRKCPQVHMQRD